MNQMGIECILHYSSIPEIFDLEIDHPDHLKHIKEESKNYKGELMTPQEMWNAYKKINPSIGDEIDAWAFWSGSRPLAELVFTGEKTATASAYDLYALRGRTPSQEGTFDVIFRQSKSSYLHCRNYQGFCSALPSSVSRPCL